MSVAYCTIAVVMSATVHPTGVNYSPANVERSSTDRLMGIFNAMTTVSSRLPAHDAIGGPNHHCGSANMASCQIVFGSEPHCIVEVSIKLS